MQTLTDAHNILLNVAAESGIFGLLGILAIILYFTNIKVFSIFEDNETNIIKVGLVLAFISAFEYQGIGGSFEDARHLWVLIGLIISSDDFLQANKN